MVSHLNPYKPPWNPVKSVSHHILNENPLWNPHGGAEMGLLPLLAATLICIDLCNGQKRLGLDADMEPWPLEDPQKIEPHMWH